jgi:hypothetical protein
MRSTLRLATAGLVALSGLVHLELWQEGYRYVDRIGPLFLVNVVVAGVLALAVLARPGQWVLAGVVGFGLGSVGALVLSRTDGGFLGFMEHGWTAEAKRALAVELGAASVAGAQLVLVSRRRSRRPARG